MDPKQAAKILKEAQEAVEAAGIRPELQPAALEKAVDLIGGSEVPESLDHPALDTSENDEVTPRSIDLASIAQKTGASREAVDDVYAVADGTLEIVLPPSKLERSKKAAATQLALLVSSGRQATGLDSEWTASEEIREVCRDFGKFDSANFAATLKGLANELRFSGTAQSTKVKLTRQGWASAGRVIKELGGSH